MLGYSLKNLISETFPVNLPKNTWEKEGGIILSEQGNNKELIFIYCIDKPEGVLVENMRYYGIDFLVWLRLRGIKNHCIITSFRPLTQMISLHDHHLILLTKGVTFLQLPIVDLVEDYVKNIRTKNRYSDRTEILQFSKNTVNVPLLRHEYANSFGAMRLQWTINNIFKTDIDILKKNQNNSLQFEILKYLNENSFSYSDKKQIESIQKHRLHFQEKRPKVLYFDDQSELWEDLLKFIFGGNLICEKPKGSFEDMEQQIISLIKREQPQCLLLDLRLQNEKQSYTNPLEYSGGKLLKIIKTLFPTLPVILFTASNKAHNFKKLLRLGAETMWTKESMDQGINNDYAIENLLQLMIDVKKAYSKFKKPIHSILYEAELKLMENEYLFDKTISINHNEAPKWFQNCNYLIVDTNVFINDYITKDPLQKEKYLKLIQKIDFLVRWNITNSGKRKIYIHKDVLAELFVNSTHIEFNAKEEETESKDKTEKNSSKIVTARFALTLIHRWQSMDKNSIYVDSENGFDYSITSQINNIQALISEFDFIPINHSKQSFFQKLAGLFSDSYNEVTKINQLIQTINGKVEKIKNLKPPKLHADSVLANITTKLLEKDNTNVVLLTNDNGCAVDVSNAIMVKYPDKFNVQNSRPKKYSVTLKDENYKVIVDEKTKKLKTEQKEAFVKISLSGNRWYNHQTVSFFNDSF